MTDNLTPTQSIANALGVKKSITRLQLNDEHKTMTAPDFLFDSLLVYCNDLYEHSEKFNEKWHHYKLRELAENNSFKIFQFWSDEVNNRLPVITSIINNTLGKSERIYARVCKLKLIEAKEAYQFFEENHLMGGTRLKAFGLFFGDTLVQAMSFQNRKDGTNIGRFCGKLGFQILGGQSKLIKAVIKHNNPHTLINFVDLRYGSGDGLLKQGFKLEKVTLGWKWTDGVRSFNRLKCRANMDDRKLTQAQHAEELGWCKIYDAGQAKYTRCLTN